ncbi:MAG: cellulase family glycosylhydrolase [Candidatus Sulfotelmatobacter sp.]
MQKRLVAILSLIALAIALPMCSAASDQPWTTARTNEWYAQQPWLIGSNFIPSTAINQLEMWQADTFDLPTIDRELGWAESLGMNTMRVFLHNLLWQQDSAGFLKRMDQFLAVADKHHIRIMFVLLDSVWDPHPHLGKQPEPRPHVHNSGWVQAPGADVLKDASSWDRELKPYIVGVLTHFRDDKRIVIWDLMNEPDNDTAQYKQEVPNRAQVALRLLKEEWKWARSVKPSQPLTSGVWKGDWSDAGLSEMARFQLENSDVITFHCYDPPDVMKKRIESLRRFRRPIICTEYMARPLGSTFASVLPLLKQEGVGAYNWGFVSGKTQTIYSWDSWEKSYSGEPPVWFHDIFRKDGTPYDPRETELIEHLTQSAPASRGNAANTD